MQDLFTRYLAEKKLRKTEERYAILECICSFPGHFDMCLLHQKLEEMKEHVGLEAACRCSRHCGGGCFCHMADFFLRTPDTGAFKGT